MRAVSENRHPRETTRLFAKQLRRESTYPERKLWGVLRGRQLGGLKFRRQHPVGPYLVDYYCHEHQLVIELDGDSHSERADYDRQRQAFLEESGYRVLRIANDDVLHDDEAVAILILQVCGKPIP